MKQMKDKTDNEKRQPEETSEILRAKTKGTVIFPDLLDGKDTIDGKDVILYDPKKHTPNEISAEILAQNKKIRKKKKVENEAYSKLMSAFSRADKSLSEICGLLMLSKTSGLNLTMDQSDDLLGKHLSLIRTINIFEAITAETLELPGAKA